MRVSGASEAAANARGVHVLKERIPRPPSLTGRAMKVRASSRARDGAGDAAARILITELARELSNHFQRCSKFSERRERCRPRRFCCRHCRRTNRACWWGTSKCLASRASSAAILASRKRSLTAVGPVQLLVSCMQRSFCITRLASLQLSTVMLKPYSSKLRTLACRRQGLSHFVQAVYHLRVHSGTVNQRYTPTWPTLVLELSSWSRSGSLPCSANSVSDERPVEDASSGGDGIRRVYEALVPMDASHDLSVGIGPGGCAGNFVPVQEGPQRRVQDGQIYSLLIK